MSIPTTLESLSTTAASNGPSGSDQRTLADDGLRQAYAFIKMGLVQGSDIASASTITPPSTASLFDVTGTTGITAIASTNSWDGRVIWLQFDGAVVLTHSSNLSLLGLANITTVAGDVMAFTQRGSGSWQMISFARKSGALAYALPNLTITPSSGVAETINYVTGAYGLKLTGAGNSEFIFDLASTAGATNGRTAMTYTLTGGTAQQWATGINADGGTSRSWQIRDVTRGATPFDLSSSGVYTFAAPSAGVLLNGTGVAGSDVARFNGGTSGSFRVNETGVPYGTSIHNNAGAVTGTTNQYIASGTYTPTLTAVTNVSASTARLVPWIRVGNVVTVTLQFDATATSTATLTQIGISLPIASNLANAFDLSGAGNVNNGSSVSPSAQISGDTTNDRAEMLYISASNTSKTHYGTFTYLIV